MPRTCGSATEILAGQADAYRRLRNTLRYLLGNLAGFSEAERLPHAQMPELERWVLHRLAELDRLVREAQRRVRFPAPLLGAAQFLRDRSVRLLLRRAQGRALLRPAGQRSGGAPRAPCSTSCSTASPRGSPRSWCSPPRRPGWRAIPVGEGAFTCGSSPECRPPGSSRRSAPGGSRIRRVRRVITGALEVERREKRIGSSLEAAPAGLRQRGGRGGRWPALDLAELAITERARAATGAPPAGRLRAWTTSPGVGVVPGAAAGPNAPAAGGCCPRSAATRRAGALPPLRRRGRRPRRGLSRRRARAAHAVLRWRRAAGTRGARPADQMGIAASARSTGAADRGDTVL